jgi:3-oxoacyl-[acyl-carrier protein] reductase
MNPSVSSRALAGRVALVTGASRRAGIGAAIATELAHAGAHLALTFFRDYDRGQAWGLQADETEDLIENLRAITEVHAVEMDLSHASAPRELIENVKSTFGRIDILVNNAAHWEPGGLDVVDAACLDRHYAVNTRATVLLCAEFSRCSHPGGPRHLIHITSGQGSGPMPGELAYVVTKASIDALTITLAHELAAQNISVFAIDPGPTDTGWLTPEQKSDLKREGKLASPTDVANLVGRLVSGDAAANSGQIIRLRR